MRDLGGYHGEHRRHGRHAGDAPHGRDATADAHAGHAPDAHARNSPERAAQDALKLKMATDPAFRRAEALKYSKKVEARNAEYAARHAKPEPRDQAQAPDQRNPREAKAEHAPLETRDKPASKLAAKWDAPESQQEERRRPQRSWMPRADFIKAVTDIGTLSTTIAAAIGYVPAKWEAVVAAGATAVVSHVVWANRRREEKKNGDRPEG